MIPASNLELARTVPSLAKHLPHMLLPLDEMIDEYVERVGLHPKGQAGKFLTAMKERLSAERYAAIQERHLSAEMLTHMTLRKNNSVLEKYLDFPVWAVSKFNTARRLEMHTGRYKRVLDLGSGPGHFGVVARYMGLEYVGVECPVQPPAPAGVYLYDELFGFFELDRVLQYIKVGDPLIVPGRFDLLTCLMGNFCVHTNRVPRRMWDAADWAWFIDDLIERVMTPDRFTMFFQIAPDYLAPAVEGLRPLCVEMTPERGTFTINETIDRAALRASLPSAAAGKG